MTPELEQLKELYEVMLEKNLDALEIKDEDVRIKLTRRLSAQPAGVVFHAAPPARASAPAQKAGAPAEEPPEAPGIEAPLAGVFYRASSPTSAPFVKEGDVVGPGQTLCIVEAMKVMNEIKAEGSSRIVKILAENGRPVTAGQTLFQTEPA